MPTEMEMQLALETRMRDLLEHANYASVGRAVGVTRTEVHRWAHGKHVTPGAVSKVQAIMRPDLPKQTEEAPEPTWVQGLTREIRMNRAVLQAALEGLDRARAARLFLLLENLLGPPALRLDEGP